MRVLILLVVLALPLNSFAHETCYGMKKLSAETVHRIEAEIFYDSLKETVKEFRYWGDMLDSTPLDSSMYAVIKSNYRFWADRLERLQEEAIERASQ